MRATETPELRTITIARDIAEEEAADAYEALSEEIQELRAEVAALRRLVTGLLEEMTALRRGMLDELVRLREALG